MSRVTLFSLSEAGWSVAGQQAVTSSPFHPVDQPEDPLRVGTCETLPNGNWWTFPSADEPEGKTAGRGVQEKSRNGWSPVRLGQPMCPHRPARRRRSSALLFRRRRGGVQRSRRSRTRRVGRRRGCVMPCLLNLTARGAADHRANETTLGLTARHGLSRRCRSLSSTSRCRDITCRSHLATGGSGCRLAARRRLAATASGFGFHRIHEPETQAQHHRSTQNETHPRHGNLRDSTHLSERGETPLPHQTSGSTATVTEHSRLIMPSASRFVALTRLFK